MVTKNEILQYTGGSRKGKDIFNAAQQHGFGPDEVNQAFNLDPGTAQNWMKENNMSLQGSQSNSMFPNMPKPEPNQGYTEYPTPIPATPNYWQGAGMQGQENQTTAIDNTQLANPNINTPFGSQQVTISPEGIPTVNREFSPQYQQRFDFLNRLMPGAMDQIRAGTRKTLGSYRFNKVPELDMGALPDVDGLSTEGLPGVEGVNPEQLPKVPGLSNQGLFDVSPVDTSQLPERSTEPTIGGQEAIAQALREREAPRFERMREQAEADLLARGFNPGTEGYEERMDTINRQQNDFNLGLRRLAGQEQSRLFGMESDLREQGLQEDLSEFQTESSARDQLFSERESMSDFARQLRSQGLDEQQVQSAVDRAIRSQMFDERSEVFDADNTMRQRALAEQLAQIETERGRRGREIDEAILARDRPIQEFSMLSQALTPQMPQFQQFVGSTAEPAPLFPALQAEGDFNLGRYGTSIQGELGTRKTDRAIKNANRGALLDVVGSIMEVIIAG